MAAAVSLRADSLSGGLPTSWNPNFLYSLPSYVPGAYYWNDDSGDGHQANVGWCLVGGPQCGMNNAPGYMAYESSAGAAPANMYFTSFGSRFTATLQVTMNDQKGGANGIDYFGYYLTDATGSLIINPTLIFSSTAANGKSYATPFTIAPGQNYGFFMENIQGVGTPLETDYFYYMDSADNTADGSMPADSLQHFAVFSNGATYYLGGVDANACEGSFQPGNSPCVPSAEFDFNDFLVEINPAAAAPEPGSAPLFMAALFMAGVWTRRRLSR